MAKDDWIKKLKTEREAAEAQEKFAGELRVKARHDFEEQADAFWAAICAEIRRVVDLYNHEVGGEPATTEVTGNAISLGWQSSAALQILFDRKNQQLSEITREAPPTGGRREHRGPSYDILVTPAGQLFIKDKDGVEGYVADVLESFFRHVHRQRL